jgi:hypothetical protein
MSDNILSPGVGFNFQRIGGFEPFHRCNIFSLLTECR